jgi:hypothetical protein
MQVHLIEIGQPIPGGPAFPLTIDRGALVGQGADVGGSAGDRSDFQALERSDPRRMLG